MARGRSLEVAGSVFWGTFDAVKQLFGGESHVQQQQQQQQRAGVQSAAPLSPPLSVSTRLDHYAAASLFMRVSAAAGFRPLMNVTGYP